ncbi:hypothetical protein [Pseudomonas sp.]|uniref:hypothetical protein n=1 Tax=Pseudomonas sp. TaxID=306 RepID=UPI0031D21EDF
MHWYDQLVRQCRATYAIHTFAERINVAPNGAALARWWEANHGPMEILQPNRKFDSFIGGALPRRELLTQIIRVAPEVADSLINPIWYALSDIQTGDSKAFWNSCADAMIIDDAPIGWFSNPRMYDLCAQPNLASLGSFVLLLRGDASKYSLHRLWIAKCFTCYLCIALLAAPARKIASDIYKLVDHLIDGGQFAMSPLRWPENLEHFSWLLDSYDLLRRQLCAAIASECGDANILLLLWLVVEDSRLLSQLYRQPKTVVIPPSVLQRWKRWCERFAHPSTRLLCSECETRLLTPAEKRVWSRLELRLSQVQPKGDCPS